MTLVNLLYAYAASAWPFSRVVWKQIEEIREHSKAEILQKACDELQVSLVNEPWTTEERIFANEMRTARKVCVKIGSFVIYARTYDWVLTSDDLRGRDLRFAQSNRLQHLSTGKIFWESIWTEEALREWMMKLKHHLDCTLF